MSGTYKTTGINLKVMPLGESDRLLTLLSPECGLIRAVAPGARKPKNSLGPRSSLFTVNQLLIVRGRSLDKVIQAETSRIYTGLSKDLGKLMAGQYLAELTVVIALSNQPQAELFALITEHLDRLHSLPPRHTPQLLAHLCQALFHLMALAGLAPQVQLCCYSQQPVTPDWQDPQWRVGFSSAAGGIVIPVSENMPTLSAIELSWLQQLAQPYLPAHVPGQLNWTKLEQLLRSYIQYQLGRAIKSADFLESCLEPTSFLG